VRRASLCAEIAICRTEGNLITRPSVALLDDTLERTAIAMFRGVTV